MAEALQHAFQHFNSHAHVERDGTWLTAAECLENFNSHAHVERDRQSVNRSKLTWNFNSHAHVERDKAEAQTCINAIISTHTLTWSVTHSRSKT